MAIRRIVTFENTDNDRRRFRFLWDGFALGGAMANTDQGGKAFDVRRREAKLARKLKAISVELDTLLPQTGDRERGLAPSNGSVVLTLDQAELDLLENYMKRAPWRPTSMDDVEDAVDFLAAAQKQESDAA